MPPQSLVVALHSWISNQKSDCNPLPPSYSLFTSVFITIKVRSSQNYLNGCTFTQKHENHSSSNSSAIASSIFKSSRFFSSTATAATRIIWNCKVNHSPKPTICAIRSARYQVITFRFTTRVLLLLWVLNGPGSFAVCA